jgi:hypothetical protein
MTDIQQNTNKLIRFISEKFEKGQLNNESLVQIIELCGAYLNISTVAQYARQNNMSYNGAQKPAKGRKINHIFGLKFIIDNQ